MYFYYNIYIILLQYEIRLSIKIESDLDVEREGTSE